MAHSLWQSQRLVYRGVDPEDDDVLAEISADPEGFLNAAPILPVPRNKKASTGYREYLTGDKTLMSAMICLPVPEDEMRKYEAEPIDKDGKKKDKPKPTPVGIVSLWGEGGEAVFAHHRRTEIAISILRQHQRKGYGGEAIKWATRWAFKRASLHRVSISAFAWNTGAVKLYESLGFKREGCRRDFLWHDGEWHDFILLAILEDEWRELYGKDP